ncbi:hypothetical protein [Streptomyces virginiae]|uniref:hypothetical protein n=1 Tax=Streptomyces virginiae TaxID=1961 RepID=UPI003660B5EE
MSRLPAAAETQTVTVLRASTGRWMTAVDVHARTSTVAVRTARAALAQLARLGIVECVTLNSSHHYRLTAAAIDEHADYFNRIDQAAAVLTERASGADTAV